MDPKLCSLVYVVNICLFLDEDDEESTYEEEEDHSQDHNQQQQELQENQLAGAKDDHSLVLEQEECADCQQSNNEASNLLLHPNSIAVADRGKASKDALDESLCGDPLMYATFVAPVHQYSTETEPSRQVKMHLLPYLF